MGLAAAEPKLRDDRLPKDAHNRLLKLKVRLKGVVDELVEGVNANVRQQDAVDAAKAAKAAKHRASAPDASVSVDAVEAAAAVRAAREGVEREKKMAEAALPTVALDLADKLLSVDGAHFPGVELSDGVQKLLEDERAKAAERAGATPALPSGRAGAAGGEEPAPVVPFLWEGESGALTFSACGATRHMRTLKLPGGGGGEEGCAESLGGAGGGRLGLGLLLPPPEGAAVAGAGRGLAGGGAGGGAAAAAGVEEGSGLPDGMQFSREELAARFGKRHLLLLNTILLRTMVPQILRPWWHGIGVQTPPKSKLIRCCGFTVARVLAKC
jgi:hypothetical protein